MGNATAWIKSIIFNKQQEAAKPKFPQLPILLLHALCCNIPRSLQLVIMKRTRLLLSIVFNLFISMTSFSQQPDEALVRKLEEAEKVRELSWV